jgi:ankyrin repeat protein
MYYTGHQHVVEYLLLNGCDPNICNDSGRTALWRCCFNGHLSIVELLLNNGADINACDKVSMESCIDVAKTPEIKDILVYYYY